MDIFSISIAGKTESEKKSAIPDTASKRKGVIFKTAPPAGGHIMLINAARKSMEIRI